MQLNRDTKIAFLGMGLMGSRMATRLLQAGVQVAVWNRTPAACHPLIDLGATALSLNQIADYPVILTCLADDQAVQSVFEQIVPYLVADQIIVDFSSLSRSEERRVGKECRSRWPPCDEQKGIEGKTLWTRTCGSDAD